MKNEHVVGIHDVQEEGQPPYLVMEYIEGISLQDKLDREGALGVKEVLRIGMQVAEGLAAAHRQGLVHRDIKPANILLENGVERVKITDFGLARAVDDASVTQSGTVAGTPMYMSPEQAEGLPIDHRSDLFSLGTVLYTMCTGHPPFRASGTHAVLKRVIEASPRPIREINSEVPDWLCGIISKLHAKKPEDRVQMAAEVAELLAQQLAHLQQPMQVAMPRPLAAKPGAKKTRFWTRRKTLVAASLLFLGIGAISAWIRLGPVGNSPVNGGGALPLAVAPFGAPKAREHQEAWAKHLGVPVEIENSVGMKLRLIPPGRFLMGTTDADPEAWNDKPQHEVTLTKPFFAGVHEVTVGQFRVFAKESGYKTEAERGAGASRPFQPGTLIHDRETSWTNPGLKQADDHPVVCVTLDDAKAFCDWLSEKEGRTYALLTEAQWEYCCRAGSQTQFFCGDDAGFLDRYGWYQANSNETTHPVGSKEANAWGLLDMHGNVSEWTADWIGRYENGPQQDPTGPLNGTQHSYRGGSWASRTKFCRSSWRELGNGEDYASASTGFRVALVGDLTSQKNMPDPSEPGWVRLFNGKDLTGWTVTDDLKNWKVKDGELIGAGFLNSYIATNKKDYRDFHLRAELTVSAIGACGILIHGAPGDDLALEVLDDGQVLRAGQEAKSSAKAKGLSPDEPIRLEVIARRGKIEVKVNGQTTTRTDNLFDEDRDRAFPIAIKSRQRGADVRIRKLEIQELKEPPPDRTPPGRLKEIGVAVQAHVLEHGRYPAPAIYDGEGKPLLG